MHRTYDGILSGSWPPIYSLTVLAVSVGIEFEYFACCAFVYHIKMNPNERSVHPSLAQVDSLVDYMERHPSLAKGYLRTASGRDSARRQWEQLSLQLNSMGGTIKTWKQWAKYWTDKKSSAKKKGMLRSVARLLFVHCHHLSGGGNERIAELSEVDERIISLMGGVGFFEGDRHLAIQPFHNEVEVTATSSVDASQAVIPPPVTETVHTDTQDVVLELIQDNRDTSHIESNATEITEQVASGQSQHLFDNAETSTRSSISNVSIFDTRRRRLRFGTEIPQILTTTPTGAVTTPTQPASRALSPIQEGQTIPSLSQQHTPPRRLRRTVMHPSPVSQRRTHLRSLSDRFLRVEEQRLEMDRRNAQWSRERDRMFLAAVTQMEQRHNEALKLLADAIKKS